jgi:thiosulfate/3-mercaptopyruvate sulfurtransferase
VTRPPREELLLEPAELAALLASNTVPLVLDVRWELSGSRKQDYLDGHVPGAVYVDLEQQLCDLSVSPEIGGRHPLPTPSDFQTAARAWGVAPDSDVVVMDGGSGMAASRCWWLLRYFGHDRVRVLDGGVKAWVQAGFGIDRGPVAPSASSTFQARPGGMGVLRAADIPEFQRAGIVLDARAAERYRGDVEPMDPVAGHIPGVLSLPTASLSEEAGRFLAADDIEGLVVGVVQDLSTPVATSCGSGVTAAHQVLAFALIGINAALVPESYSWWCRQPDRAIAVGSKP